MKSILLSILIAPSIICKAQNADVKVQDTQTFNQQIHLQYSGSNQSTARIIEKMAEGNGKVIRAVDIQFSFVQKLTTTLSGNSLKVVISSTALQPSGDLLYKGFTVQQQLIPDRIDFSALVYKNNSLFDQATFQNINIENATPNSVQKLINEINPKIIRYEIKNISLTYSNAAFNNFVRRANLINDYYGASAHLDQAYSLLQNIYPGNIENINEEQQKFINARAIIAEAENCNYISALDLNSFDPSRLLNKLSACKSLAALREADLNNVMHTIHLALYDKGMMLMQNGDWNHAERCFLKSLAANPSFAPALLQIARIDFKRGDLNEVACKADVILYKLYPDPETRDYTFRLLEDVNEVYMDKGVEKLNRNDYIKADEYFTRAYDLCQKFSGLRCTDELFNDLRKAHIGIYNNYLAEARSHYQKNNLDGAEASLSNASSYQKKYQHDIANADEAGQILKGVKQKRYDILITEARLENDKADYENELTTLNAARQLANDYQLTGDRQFNELQSAAALSLINKNLSGGSDAVNKNNLDEAKVLLRSAYTLQQQYGFENDRHINEVTDALRKKIFSQQCINAQQEFDSFRLKGINASAEFNYRLADENFSAAKRIAEMNADCNLNMSDVLSAHSAILPAATYLKLTDNAVEFMRQGDYRKSIETWKEAEGYYGRFDVGKFKIQPLALYDFIMMKGNDGLLYYAGDMYLAEKEIDKAYGIYKTLMEKGHSRQALKGPLYKLGFMLAQHDRTLHPGDRHWKNYVTIYTQGNSKWASLSRGYKKGWKS